MSDAGNDEKLNPEKKPITMEQYVNELGTQIQSDLEELDGLIDQMGHSQAKRLLRAELWYPLREDPVDGMEDIMRTAILTSRRLKDSLVALATESVLQKNLGIEQQLMEDSNGKEQQ
jgi:hypothetical protein